ncbi:MAG: hypothetical protein P1U58_10255 [Verrucomicrobiales bacterium]|nr:hypothetical protein [Verrucomicrobiales bacterium]
MQSSFQTLAVGAVVTGIHLAIIVAMKPASIEASKYFQALDMDSFVEEVFVKRQAGEPGSRKESNPDNVVVGVEDILGRTSSEEPLQEESPIAGPEQPVEMAESFMDLEKEMDSVRAVADVRIFAGRIPEPKLEEYTSERMVAEPVATKRLEQTPPAESIAEKAALKAGPFELREIHPVSRR